MDINDTGRSKKDVFLVWRQEQQPEKIKKAKTKQAPYVVGGRGGSGGNIPENVDFKNLVPVVMALPRSALGANSGIVHQHSNLMNALGQKRGD